MAIWLVAAALVVVAGVKLLMGSGDPPPAPVRLDRPAADRSRPGAEPRAQTVYVHLAGAVRRPGLVQLPPGTRVATALEKVGGPTRRADLTLVNLAAEVQDGQQIVVPVAGAAPAGAGPEAGTETAPAAKIHLSTATAEQLDQVDGLGPTLAARIIEFRDAHGGFRSIQELAEVDGIGEKRLATLREALQP
jgi:competence protein ComEA